MVLLKTMIQKKGLTLPIKLSLICPVYKVGKYIPELMESLLAGVNDEQVEVIFVDDCCPENSIVLCEQFINEHHKQLQFKPIIIKLPVNQGQAVARNEALKIAKGDYIGFIDSDDAIATNYWAILSPYINEQKQDIIEFTYKEFSDILPRITDDIVCELSSSNLNPFHFGFFVWTRLYKKELINELTFPIDLIYEDIFYNIHAFAKARKIVRLSNCLIYYRQRKGSTTNIRTSTYSNLLLNLVTAVQSNIECFDDQSAVVAQVARYSLRSALKGGKIKERSDRRLFYTKSQKIILNFTPLFNSINRSLIVSIKLSLAKLVCSLGRFS